MKHLFTFPLRLVYLCCLLTTLNGCSEDLYKSRGVVPDQQSSAMPEKENTLLSLTPFRGEHADSLKQTGLLTIQETTNYQQKLPDGIDVVYVNVDYASPELGDSPLFIEALEKTTVLIDGSAAKMEAFKENLPVFFPNAQMIAYVPADEGDESGFETIVYGPQDNALSSGMLLASLWSYSPPPNTAEPPYPAYDLTPPNDAVTSISEGAKPLDINPKNDFNWSSPTSVTKTDAVETTNGVQSIQGCDANWWSRCYGADNLKVEGWNSLWGKITDNCGNRRQIKPDNYGCHYFNEKIGWDRTYWESNEWGAYNRLYISRQNCWESKSYRGAKITWLNPKYWRKDNAKKDAFFEQNPKVKFSPKACKQCYLDMNIVEGKSKSWGVKYASGLEVGVDVGALSASVSKSFSNETSQSVKVDRQSQREFWVNKCMFAVGGGVVYGRVKVVTLSQYVQGNTEYNLTIRYIREPYRKNYGGREEPALERNITYCVRSGAPSDIIGSFSGDVRISKYYWISAGWFNKQEKRIRTFANCKVKK